MRKFIFKQSICIIVCLLTTFICLAEANNIGVFTLSNRDANEVKNSIQGFLSPGAVVTVDQNKIIIKSDVNNLADLKQIIAALDTEKKQLKLEVYWGDSPDDMVSSTVISTDRGQSNKVQTLHVEDGEMVALTKTSIVKVMKAAAGGQQQLQMQEHSKEAVDTGTATAMADVAVNIVNKNKEISDLNKNIKNTEKAIIAARGQGNTAEVTRLEGVLRVYKETDLPTKTSELEALQARQKSLEARGTSGIDKQSSYDATEGAINQDFINLPEGIYLKPKMLNDKQFKVDINIIKAGEGVKKTAADVRAMTQQVRTIMQITVNKWQKISGQDDMSNSEVTTYSTSTNSNEQKVWLKITVVNP